MRNKKGQFMKGTKPSHGFKKGGLVWNKGKKGIRLSPKSEFKKGTIPHNKGTPMSEDAKENLRKKALGKKKRGGYSFGFKDKNPGWKGGVTPENVKIRQSQEYKLWRTAVFQRDSYTCIWCKTKGGELHADHIKPFAHFPELRFAIDNGRTLCVDCHKTTDTYLIKSRWLK